MNAGREGGRMLRRGGSRFLAVSDQARQVVVISEATVVASHWLPAEGRSQRCGGPGCPLCAGGDDPTDRAYVWVQAGDGTDRIFEFRARQEEQLNAQGVMIEQIEGVELRIRRKGQAYNSPVMVEVVGRIPGQGRRGPDEKLLGLSPPAPVLPDQPNGKLLKVHPEDPAVKISSSPTKRRRTE